jgi:hypothetical protein
LQETVEQQVVSFAPWSAVHSYVQLQKIWAFNLAAIGLCGQRGVHQIALDASRLSFATITTLAGIAGLQSLVLARPALTEGQRSEFSRLGPVILEADA